MLGEVLNTEIYVILKLWILSWKRPISVNGSLPFNFLLIHWVAALESKLAMQADSTTCCLVPRAHAQGFSCHLLSGSLWPFSAGVLLTFHCWESAYLTSDNYPCSPLNPFLLKPLSGGLPSYFRQISFFHFLSFFNYHVSALLLLVSFPVF